MSTLVELLHDRAADRPSATPYVFLEDGEDDARAITMAELDLRARQIASLLLEHARPGDRALLVAQPGLDYIAAFFGCLYAGVIAVPAYPPDPRRLARTVPRLVSIVRAAEATVLVTTAGIRALAPALVPHAPELERLRWIAIDDARGDAWTRPAIGGESIAMLQFTSGSTAEPRGVILTHEGILANLAAITAAFRLDESPPRILSWLPPYHDMGLIGGVLGSLYSGGSSVLMSPLHFLQRPVRWLRAIAKHRADVSGGPNFAYELCLRKVDPLKETIDLSCWQVAFDGAEVVRASTLERFADKFAAWGVRKTALFPCYGLAETALFATGAARGEGWVTREIDGVVRVSSGRPPRGVEVAIVDPESREVLPESCVGEVWLAGKSIGRGYWGIDSASTFAARTADDRGPFLRTGDLGALVDGELFVTGRIKDVIIANGRKLYPDDIERVAASAHSALRPGGTAAFADDVDDVERLVIAQEIDGGDREAIRSAITRAIVDAFDVAPVIVLVPPGTVPKTSSGKVQRHACRALRREMSGE